MNKLWVYFLQSYMQKAKTSADKDVSFKEKDVIQLDEASANKLIELGMCRKAADTEIPKHQDMDAIVKSIEGTIQTSVENILAKAVKNAGDNLTKNPLFAQAKDHEKEGMDGFVSEGEFLATVMKASDPQGAYHNKIIKAFGIDQKHLELLRKAPSGQNISSDSEGGFAVPDTIASRIWDNMADDPVSIYGKTEKFTTAGNNMKIPVIEETSRKAGFGKRFGGVQVYWLDEAEEFQSTKAKMGKKQMDLHKIGALTYATEEQLDDEGFNFTGWIKDKVPRALAFTIAESFIWGSGTGKPQGVMNADALIVVPIENGQGNHTILHHNLNKMYWRNINRSRAVWYMHPDLIQKLEFIYFDDDTTNKRPVFLPANQIANVPMGVSGFVYGRPVIDYEFMKDFGSRGDALFADFGEYGTLRKVGGGIKYAESIHVRFLFEERAFRWSTRIDGRSLWAGSKEDLNGDTTRSPFVTLASRTGGASSSGL